jgi:hypothetical protein
MPWITTDASFFDSFTQGTFEDVFPSSAYPQNTIISRYKCQDAFTHSIAEAYAGTGSGELYSFDELSMLQLYCGKGRTNGRRYTISGKIKFVPNLSVWDSSDEVFIKFGIFGGMGEVSYDIRNAIAGWMSFSTQVSWVGGSDVNVNAVDLSVRYTIFNSTSTDPLTASSIFFDQLTAIEEEFLDVVPLSATYTKTDVTSSGGSDGTIVVTPAGGSGTYTYVWGDGPTTQNRSGLPSGTYIVTVTDSGTAETVDLTIYITEPEPTPTVLGTLLQVPLMNSLTFVVNPIVPDNCTTFQEQDNVLFCHQVQPGFEAGQYYNKVCKCDLLTTQFNTDFNSPVVTLHDYDTDELIKTFINSLKEQNIGVTEDFSVYLKNHTDFPGQSRVYFGVGAPPIPLSVGDSFEILNNVDGYNGTYTIVDIQNDISFGYQYLVINKNYVGPGTTSSATGRFTSNSEDFNVYESPHDFSDVAVGVYYVKITVSDSGSTQYAVSEPIDLQVDHSETTYVEARNVDNALGLTFTTGYIIKLRVPAVFFKRFPGGAQNISRDSDYSMVKTEGIATRMLTLEVYMVPPYLHEKLSWLFKMDFFSINKVEFQTDQAYADPQYLDRFMLANSSIKLEKKQLFNNYNSDDIGSIAEGGFLVTETGYLKI